MTPIATVRDADLVGVRAGQDAVRGNKLLLAEPNLGAIVERMGPILAQGCERDIDRRLDPRLAHATQHGAKAVVIFLGRHRRVIGVRLALMPAQHVDRDTGPLEPMERAYKAAKILA